MKKVLKRGLCVLLSVLTIIAILPQVSLTAKASTGVDDFVKRCYQVALGREPEPEGFNDWTSKLNNGQIVGFVIAREFIFSDEYKAKNKSDDEFIKDLYMMFVNREPEQAGYDYWMNQLDNHVPREEVFAGFSNSAEFINICNGYGITAGYYSNEYDITQINNVNLFVERLYKTTLDRIGDPTGQEYWAKGLLEKRLTGAECAANFIKSNEFESKGLSDEEYLKVLYAGIMGRTPDEGGLKYWLDSLANGTKTRDQVFEGFSKSDEFKGICNTYGINCGEYTATDVINPGEVVIYDFQGVKIIAKSPVEYYGTSGAVIRVSVENSTDEEISILAGDTYMNGKVVHGIIIKSIIPSKSTAESGLQFMEIDPISGSAIKIDKVDDVSVQLGIMNSLYERTYSYPIKIHVDDQNNVHLVEKDRSRNISFDNKIILNNNGIKVAIEELYETSDKIVMEVEVENNSGRIIYVGLTEGKVNNIRYDSGSFSELLPNGAKKKRKMYIDKEWIAEYLGITSVETWEFKVYARDYNTYENIITTEPIIINLK